MGPILGPVLKTILDPKITTKMAKKPLWRGSQNGADFWTGFKGAGAQAQRNAQGPGEITEGVPEAGERSKS